MMRLLLVLIVVFVSAQSTRPPLQLGSLSCSMWLASRQDGSPTDMYYGWWLQGFLEGAAALTDKPTIEPEPMTVALQRVMGICRLEPDQTVQAAALHYLRAER